MRTIFCSAALLLVAIFNTGCATLKMEKGSCDGNGCTAGQNCCSENRLGGLMGRLRGESACVDCGNNGCQNGSCGNASGGGMIAGGMRGGGMMAGGTRGGGMMAGGRLGGGRGILAGALGRGGAAGCQTCGQLSGQCRCVGNQAPYTPQPFAGPHGPLTGHVGYPYYTTRAPRDFLMPNPPSIGP